MMNTDRRAAILHYLAYFSLLLAIGIFVRDIPSQPPLSSSIHSFQKIINMGDPIYFAMGALDVFQNGWFTPESRWLINLWPPGFMLLEGAILRIFGENAPFIVVLLTLSALLQAFWMLTLRQLLRPLVPALAAFLLPLLPFAFPVTRLFLLEPTGLALGEAFSVGAFLSFVLLTLLAVRSQSFWLAIGGGALLGISAYFRSQYGIIVTMFTLGALPIGLWLLLSMRRMPRPLTLGMPQRSSLKTIVLAIVAAQVVMLPWRAYVMLELDRTTWVSTQQLVAQNGLSSTQTLHEAGGAWLVRGGANVACLVAPEYCGEKNPSLYYRAFLEHPVEWTYRKAVLLDDYWFASIRDWTMPYGPQAPGDMVSNTLLLIVMLALFPLFWLLRREREIPVQLWIFGSFFVCYAAIFTLAHLEIRYFYLIKIFAVVATILLAAMAWKRWRSAGQADLAGGSDFGAMQIETSQG